MVNAIKALKKLRREWEEKNAIKIQSWARQWIVK